MTEFLAEALERELDFGIKELVIVIHKLPVLLLLFFNCIRLSRPFPGIFF